jgi:hypothetical protein
MTDAFDAVQGLVVVRAELTGPSGSAILRLALDTGATASLVNVAMLTALGCEPAPLPERIQVTTGSSVEFVPQITLHSMEALGHKRDSVTVLGHTLPPSAGVDGIIGLDFLRGHVLTIDFRRGTVRLD